MMIPGWMMLWRSVGVNHRRRSIISKGYSHSTVAKRTELSWANSWRSKASGGLVQTCPA